MSGSPSLRTEKFQLQEFSPARFFATVDVDFARPVSYKESHLRKPTKEDAFALL